MKNYKENLDIVLDYVIDEIEKHNGSIYLHSHKMAHYRNKPYSTAYFEDEKKHPEIHIGWDNKPEILIEVLLHEFCHFLQYTQNTKIWKTGRKDPNNKMKAAMLELECEQLTIKLAKAKFKGFFNTETYIKRANAYVYFYAIYKLTNKWYDTPPYTIDSIVEMMPSKLLKKIDENTTLSPKLIKEYMKCYK